MTFWLAVAGWPFAAALAVQCGRLVRRLERVARADHELRAPVSALALAVEALGRCPELRRHAEALESHLDRLRLGLAELAAVRAGRRTCPRPSNVTLEAVARAAVDAWRPAARAAGRDVCLDWRAGELEARADRARLSQALGNVLGNALEHGTGVIEVHGERRNGGLSIAVTDEGPEPGTSDGDARAASTGGSRGRPRVAFRRGRGAGSRLGGRRGSGRGRGLRIARHAIAHAGGALSAPEAVASESEGTGRLGGRAATTVAMELPAREVRID